ncbi:S8 family serine peptidase [Isoptericola sp. AK164]|uniref:S8 family serine peptidase n=1 Tax=Isoptericola sp. AK164 TaxID=3024246 RepID=UPI0024188100|nr:S8 family serine peptidase [Isoptericola sp. AK164]
MSETTIEDAAGGRRPVRHLDPDRVRRSPGASRVRETDYVADRLIVRGGLPEDLRRRVVPEAAALGAGGQGAMVALDDWAGEGEPTSWLDGVRRIATEMGYRVVYDGTLGDLAGDEVDDETFGYALRLVPLRDDDVEVDVWQVLERIVGELGALDERDDADEGDRPTPRVGLDHVLRAQRHRSTPLPFVPVARPRSTPLPFGAIDEYGVAGSGGLTPVGYLGAPPRRSLADGPTPWHAADGTRRPVVAVVDTGVGSHDWFGDYDPHDPQDSAVVVRTATLDGRPVGTFPVPRHATADADFGGLSVDPLTGPLDPVAGHGTFMAGVVHQVCPDAVLMAVRAFGGSGDIPEWEVLHTLWRLLRFHRRGVAGDPGYHQVDVVVLAMGYYHEQPEDYGYDGPLRRVLRALRRAGVVVVLASGNDGTTRPMFPAAWAPHLQQDADALRPVDGGQLSDRHPPLLVAGAANPDGTTAIFSNDGPWVTCIRPGAAVLSTMPTTLDGPETPEASVAERLRPGTRATVDPDDFTGGFATWSGTSFSAPYLAGEVAAARLRTGARGEVGVDGAWDAVTRTVALDRAGGDGA